jgi:hypothetical protein
MNTHFLWPALGIMAVYATWVTVLSMRALDAGGKPGSALMSRLFAWCAILGAAVFGYLTGGIPGFILLAVACYLLPVTTIMVVAILTRRVRRR